MARGNIVSPPTAASLPKAEFEIVNDEKLKLPGGTHDMQARTFGYNKFDDFQRPEHYIRHIEPLESDLAKTVEYDMDEQDQEWLDAINAERSKAQIDKVSCESFEIIMDRLEKEWYDLTKNIPKPDFAMPSEDSTCAICDDSEGENSNAIVFCDGCNLAVHQDCYGVPYIPEGQWLCRKCTVSPEVPVDCYLCPNEGGAFKQAVGGEWVHLLCAIWIPETRVANDVFMEPITGLEKISKQRWKLRCSICDYRGGACIQCAKSTCFVAFHATCARKEKLLMPMKSMQGAEPASLTCFCDKHLPQEQQDIRTAALEQEEAREHTGPSKELATKSARAYAKTYKPGPPLVPAIIVERINRYISRIKIRKKVEFIQQMSRYWSLKREARRGAPLLKRLHLEPWTANAGAKVLTREEKTMRLDQLTRLRQDLLNVQSLTDLLRKRETRKLRQTEVIHEVLSQGLFPHHSRLRFAFERIMSLDRKDHFKMPVSKQDVPDYYEIIKEPMCWNYIDAKLDQHQYWDLQSFINDVELVIRNALTYNKSGTTFHKLATRIFKDTRPILADLESLRFQHEELSQHEQAPDADDIPDTQILPGLGDLEPPLSLLKLFVSSEAIKQGLNMELTTDPASALFNFEFAKVKPPPPVSPEAALVPPPAPRVRNRPKKRDYKAELERARINKERRLAEAAAKQYVEGTADAEAVRQMMEAEAAPEPFDDQEVQYVPDRGDQPLATPVSFDGESDASPTFDGSLHFRIPRTRRAVAASAAFEAEAHAPPIIPPPVPPHDLFDQQEQPPVAGPSESPSDAEKPRPRRPPPISTHVQLSIPQVVHDVDNRDSFKMFNAGWILPNDQKRGGRTTTERPPLPPPRKRQRTAEPSRLSVVSTEPSDNHTLRKTTPPLSSDPHESDHKHHDDENAMDVDSSSYAHEPPSTSRHVTPFSSDLHDSPHNIITQPNGVVIIEKLDSPATRREKNMRRKADKQRRAYGADSNPVVISADSSNNSFRNSSPVPVPQSSAFTEDNLATRVDGASHVKEQAAPGRVEATQSDGQPMDVDGEEGKRGFTSQLGVALNDPGRSQSSPSWPQRSPRRPAPAASSSSNRPGSNLHVQRAEDDLGDESELSDLSSDSDEQVDGLSVASEEPADTQVESEQAQSEQDEPLANASRKRRSNPRKRGRPAEKFEDGAIVWAKSESYPWWPAVVFADGNKQVPSNILNVHKEKKSGKRQKFYIVQFYDKQASWSSVAKDKLQLLGEDNKLDEELLTSNPRQKFKTPAQRLQCRESYRVARSDVDAAKGNVQAAIQDGDEADGESSAS